jgi:hypothetical protein
VEKKNKGEKKNVGYGEIKVAKAVLKKRDDKKGHVFELLFSNELGEVGKKMFSGINCSTSLF